MGYYNGLKSLVEEMYAANNMTRVTLVVHSLGGPVSLYFLNNIVNQTWKDTYIHAYIPVAAAWDGAVAALEIIFSGTTTKWFNFLIPRSLRKTIIDTTRSFQSVFWLLPSAQVFGNTTLVQIGTMQYTAHDFEDLFQVIRDRDGFADGYAMYTNVAHLVDGWNAPNVTTYCYYGLQGNRSTTLGLKYDRYNSPNSPTMRWMENGDGTVNQRVLEICHRWANNQNASFEWRTFDAAHIGILSDDELLEAIEDVITIQECEDTETTMETSGNILTKVVDKIKDLIRKLFG